MLPPTIQSHLVLFEVGTGSFFQFEFRVRKKIVVVLVSISNSSLGWGGISFCA